MWQLSRPGLFYFLFLLVSACSSNKQALPQDSQVFCDHYFIYSMCVKDLTGNGEVDIMYFADTNETFMFWRDTANFIPDDYPFHKCVQLGDESLRTISSRLLQVNNNLDDSPEIEASRIKTQLLLSYSRYSTRVNRCHNPNWEEGGDSFGDEVLVDF